MSGNRNLWALGGLAAVGIYWWVIRKPSAKFKAGDVVRVIRLGDYQGLTGTVETAFWGPDYGLPRRWYYNLAEFLEISFSESDLAKD